MRRAGWGWPMRERAARWSPAIQPSVRWERVARSAGCQGAQAHGLGEEGGGLLGGEAQVSGAQLPELVAGTQAGEGEGGIVSGGEDEVEGRGEVVEEAGEEPVDGGGGGGVVVIQDQDPGSLVRGQLVQQGGEEGVGGRGQGGGEEGGEEAGAQGRHQGVQGGEQAGEEAGGVALGRLQGEPGDGSGGGEFREPGGEEGGFAEAGGSGEQGEAAGDARVQAVEQAEASDQMGPWSRPSEFGGEQGCRHGSIIRYAPLTTRFTTQTWSLRLVTSITARSQAPGDVLSIGERAQARRNPNAECHPLRGSRKSSTIWLNSAGFSIKG